VARAQSKFDFRAVNLIDGLSSADLFINNTPPAAITLAHEWITPLVKYPATTINLKFAPSGSSVDAAVVGRDITAAGNVEYIAVAYGTTAQAKIAVLERPREQRAPAGKSLIRILAASSIPGAFDIYMTSTSGEALFTGLTGDNATRFDTVPGEGAALIVTPAGQKTALAKFNVSLVPNGIMTLIVTGSSLETLNVYALSGENAEGYQLPVLKAVEGGGLPSSIRVVHAWRQRQTTGSNIQSLDTYIDGVIKARDLRYRVASEKFGPYASDTATVRFTPLDEGSTTIFTRGIKLHNDSDYTVVLTRNSQQAANTLVLATPNTPLTSGSLFVRVANVAGDLANARVKLFSPASSSTPVLDTTLAYLTSTGFAMIDPTDFRIDVSMPNGSTPILTRTEPTAHPPGYLTYLIHGDGGTFMVDLLDETMITRQVFDPASSVPNDIAAATAAIRLRNVPNPFTAATAIGFTMPHAGQVSIVLFDALGREVSKVMDEYRQQGDQRVMVNAGDLSAGTYIYRLTVDGVMQGAGRMVLTR